VEHNKAEAICGSPSPGRFARHRIINSSGKTQTQWLSHPPKKKKDEESLWLDHFGSSSQIKMENDGHENCF
jgi:hypothetical protein